MVDKVSQFVVQFTDCAHFFCTERTAFASNADELFDYG